MNARDIIQHSNYKNECKKAGFAVADADILIQNYLQQAIAEKHPKIVHMLGIPGAGKTTYLKSYPYQNAVLIGFDDIMESLPCYQADKQSQGVEQAFKNWEVPAREIGYEILFQAIENRMNIIFDNGGSRSDHIELLAEMKNQGYEVTVIHLPITQELARERAARRERNLPLEYIPQRMALIESLIPRYKDVANAFIEVPCQG